MDDPVIDRRLDLPELLTVAEAAEVLRVHPNTVKRLGDRGELPFFRVVRRGDRRIRRSDLEAYIRRMRG